MNEASVYLLKQNNGTKEIFSNNFFLSTFESYHPLRENDPLVNLPLCPSTQTSFTIRDNSSTLIKCKLILLSKKCIHSYFYIFLELNELFQNHLVFNRLIE